MSSLSAEMARPFAPGRSAPKLITQGRLFAVSSRFLTDHHIEHSAADSEVAVREAGPRDHPIGKIPSSMIREKRERVGPRKSKGSCSPCSCRIWPLIFRLPKTSSGKFGSGFGCFINIARNTSLGYLKGAGYLSLVSDNENTHYRERARTERCTRLRGTWTPREASLESSFSW